MSKFLFFIFVGCLSVMPFNVLAESNSQQRHLDSLNVKIVALSHDLDYLRLTYEIYVLNADLKIVAMGIENQIRDIKMCIYHHDFNIDMYKQYKELYDSYRGNLDATKELISVKQNYFLLKVFTDSLTEEEKDLLSRNYRMADGLYQQAELSLNMMKSAIDLYYKYM